MVSMGVFIILIVIPSFCVMELDRREKVKLIEKQRMKLKSRKQARAIVK